MNPFLTRIRGRLVWMSLLSVGLAIGSFVLGQWVYGFTDDQCTWRVKDNKVRILEILPEGVAEDAGLLEGDELLAIQGRKVKASREGLNEAQNLIDSKAEGTVLSYAIRREGEALQVPVRLVKRFNSLQLALLINGIIFWAVGLLVVVSTPERKSSRHFFYLGCGALLLAANPRGFQAPYPLWLRTVDVAIPTLAQALLPPLWVHFFLRFPHPFGLRKNRRLLLGLYGGFACLALIGLAARILGAEADERRWEFIQNAWFALAGWLTLASIFAGVAFFGAGVRRMPAARRKLFTLPLMVVGALGLDLLALVIFNRIYAGSLIFGRKRWIFMAAMPLLPFSFGYAVVRHGLFDVRRSLLRWLGFFALTGLAIALYLGALAGAIHAGAPLLVNAAWLGALAGLLVLPMGWILRALLGRLRRWFRRDHGAIREQILGVLRESPQRLSESGLVRHFEQAVRDAYQPHQLLVLDAAKGRITLPSVEAQGEDGAPAPFPPSTLILPPSLLRHARDNRELVLGMGSEEADWIQEQGPRLRAHVDALGIQLMVLLMAHEEFHTALFLGGKYAQLNYGREDRELLREAAMAAGAMIETVQLHQRVVAQERASQELATARRIQENLLPQKAPDIPGFQIALRLEPAMETGGDLLFLKRRPSGRWIAAVGDVSGKGLAAALYMSQAIALLELAACQEQQPLEQILERMDLTLRHLLGQRGFLTLVIIEWDDAGHYRLARAGHPGALLMEPGAEPRELMPHGRGLGLRPAGPGDWEILEGVLPPKSWIVLYSDGLTEAMDHAGELYGLPRLGAQLKRLWGTGSARAACEAVFREVAGFEAQNRDDRTLFILGREAA